MHTIILHESYRLYKPKSNAENILRVKIGEYHTIKYNLLHKLCWYIQTVLTVSTTPYSCIFRMVTITSNANPKMTTTG